MLLKFTADYYRLLSGTPGSGPWRKLDKACIAQIYMQQVSLKARSKAEAVQTGSAPVERRAE